MSDRSFLQQECVNSSFVQPTKGLFGGDLSSSTTERDLQILFGAIGKVIAVEVKRGRHGDSLLHGFVEFDTEECAYSAIQTLNGLKFKGRKMRYAYIEKFPICSLFSNFIFFFFFIFLCLIIYVYLHYYSTE